MRHNEKSENITRERRVLVVASQTVGVVAVHRPSSTQPLRLWPILSFSNDCSLGGYNVDSVVSDSSGFTPQANRNERDASSEQRRKKHG